MRIKYEVSAGGLVLRWNGGSLEALLIGRGEPRVWSLPKGHVEAKETHEQAALREVREETGCWAEILSKLSDISYWFYLNRTKHKKSVHFYLMRYLSGDTANHDHEVDEARWFEIRAAKKALKYVNEKRLVDLGLDWLQQEGAGTLEVNWRSDGAFVGALQRVFKGATFGDPRIEFVSVEASEDHRDLRLETEEGAVGQAVGDSSA